jgi:hypothetical protein
MIKGTCFPATTASWDNFNGARRVRGRGSRDDCGEHFVFERQPANGSFIPDPRLFVVEYLNCGGGRGKRNACCTVGDECLPMFAILCGLRFRDVGNAFCISSCCGVIFFVQWCCGKCSVGAVLTFSCGGTRMFTYIRVGTVLSFSYGETCMFTYILGCRGWHSRKYGQRV